MPCCRKGVATWRSLRSWWGVDAEPPARTGPPVVLNADHQSMVTGEGQDGRVPGLDPARVDDSDADALVGQARGHLDADSSHRADADDQYVAGTVADQHVHRTGPVDRLDGCRRRALRDSQH